MRDLTIEEKEILAKHAKWLNNEEGGERANLSGADLSWADLREANLIGADLSWADLSWADLHEADLAEANLHEAYLTRANLTEANLTEANLCGADLRWADLRWADLREANLCGADFDFSAWPLHCGSTNVKADDRLIAQLIYHITRLDVVNCSDEVKEQIEIIRKMKIADKFCEYRTDLQMVEKFLNNQKSKE